MEKDENSKQFFVRIYYVQDCLKSRKSKVGITGELFRSNQRECYNSLENDFGNNLTQKIPFKSQKSPFFPQKGHFFQEFLQYFGPFLQKTAT